MFLAPGTILWSSAASVIGPVDAGDHMRTGFLSIFFSGIGFG
jgi:hypothetical protein